MKFTQRSNKRALATRKLVLHKEAIALLSTSQLTGVAGGDGSGPGCVTGSFVAIHVGPDGVPQTVEVRLQPVTAYEHV